MKEQAANKMQRNLVDRKETVNKVNNFEQRMCLILKLQKLGWAKIKALKLLFSTHKTVNFLVKLNKIAT